MYQDSEISLHGFDNLCLHLIMGLFRYTYSQTPVSRTATGAEIAKANLLWRFYNYHSINW